MYLFESNFIARLFVEHVPIGHYQALKGPGSPPLPAPLLQAGSGLGRALGAGVPSWGRREFKGRSASTPLLFCRWGMGRNLLPALGCHDAQDCARFLPSQGA